MNTLASQDAQGGYTKNICKTKVTINNPNFFPFWLISMQTHPRHKRAVRGSLSLLVNSARLQKALPKLPVMPSDRLLILACRCRRCAGCHCRWHLRANLGAQLWGCPMGAGTLTLQALFFCHGEVSAVWPCPVSRVITWICATGPLWEASVDIVPPPG